MRKIFFTLLLVINIFFINVNIANAYACRFDIKDGIKNVNEKGEIINSKFALTSIDKKVIFNYHEENNLNVLDKLNLSIEDLEPLLPEDYYKNINSLDDAKRIAGAKCFLHENTDINDCSKRINKSFHTVLVLEQTTPPTGYKKSKKYIVLYKLEISYYYNENENEFEEFLDCYYGGGNIDKNNSNSLKYYEYDENYDYSRIPYMTDSELESFRQQYTTSIYDANDRINIITNQKGTVNLEIDNYISGESSVKASKIIFIYPLCY